MNIHLPKGAFIVKPEERKEKTPFGIYLGADQIQEVNEGTIIYTSEELSSFKNLKVVFRPSFAEDINIGGENLKFFRDFNSSIYYTYGEN